MPDIAVFIMIGFLAQLVDGALGMAFGVLSTTALLAFGVTPAAASAMTHIAEVFTTAFSGVSHAYFRNVEWRLVLRLAPAGMVGGVIGALVLGSVDPDQIKPIISIYLMTIGVYIVVKAMRPLLPHRVRDWMVPFVGFGGGILDAMGGGGWGPLVTGSLIGRRHLPRKVIGSANVTEFMVTVVISATFILTLGWPELNAALGLIIGGAIAAPIGGLVASRIPTRPLMLAVGALIIVTTLVRIL